MPASADWQPDREATELYERILVPALLGPFARSLVEWAALRPGDWVLDVGCGTGAASRAAAQAVGPTGRVVGVERSPAMLASAQAQPQTAGRPVEWREGDVTQMTLPARVFDVVLCAQTLQYLPECRRALFEMRRVLRPGGRLALSAWCERSQSPYFEALHAAVTEIISAAAAQQMEAGFDLADRTRIERLLDETGFKTPVIAVNRLDFALAELEVFTASFLRATPLAEDYRAAGEAAQAALAAAVRRKLEGQPAAASGWIPFQSYFVRATI